jgi:hypothetical protein
MSDNLIKQLDEATKQRGDSLHALKGAVKELLSELDKHCHEDWASVEVSGYTLEIVRVKSNAGSTPYWYFDGANLELEIDTETYLHGDFHAHMHGPSEDQLREFALRAGRFVEALIQLARVQTNQHEAGADACRQALSDLRG